MAVVDGVLFEGCDHPLFWSMGGFSPVCPPLLVNGRPAYQAADGRCVYLYFNGERLWVVSTAERDMRAGRNAGTMHTDEETGAETPDQVTGQWKVWKRVCLYELR